MKGIVLALAVNGLFVPIVVGLVLEGVRRKLRARLQGRIGPPILQPLYDVVKLLRKSATAPRCYSYTAYVLAPALSLAGACAASALIPLAGCSALSFEGDLLVVLLALSLSALMTAVGGFASGNPYSALGSSRLVSVLIVLEIPAALIAASVAVQAGTLSLLRAQQAMVGAYNPLITAALVLYALGKLWVNPFSIPSAETEIMEGPLIEYSGPRLALFKMAHAAETYALASLTSVFLLGPALTGVPGIIVQLAACLVVVVVYTLVEVAVARLRLDQALRFYALYSSLLGALALALAVVWGGVA